MSQYYNIRWRVQDEKELRRVARNFNAKLRREIKKNPENWNILPQFYNENTEKFESRITMDLLHDLIQTRADYNRIVNMLKRFSKKGAEEIVDLPDNTYGTKTTKWWRNELPRLASIVNKKRGIKLNQLKNVEMQESSGKLGYTLGERFGMGLASRNQLQPTTSFTRGQSQTDVKQKARNLLRESTSKYYQNRDKLLKQNYINEIKKNFNQVDVQDVINAIENMNEDLFVMMFESRGDKFESVYPPDRNSSDYWNYVSELKGYWLKDVTVADISTPAVISLLNQ